MEVIYFNNEFPREDLQDTFRRLYNNSKDRRHHLLSQFMTDATQAVKEEIQHLPLVLQQLFPPFETLHMWAENVHLREGLLCGAVEGVLLIHVQVASYISYVETNPGAHRRLSSTHFTALGVGLLSATAVSLTDEIADLPFYGAEAIRIAFRMGVHVQYVSQQLETRELTDKTQTWAYVVHDVDPNHAQQELEALYKATPAPVTGKIFISAVSRASVTVSGPPSKLKGLFQKSKMFRDATSIALPVYGGLCHAPHVYGPRDTTVIVHGGNDALNAIHQTNGAKGRPLHSTSTGSPYTVASGVELFESVVTELLTQTIEWDKVVANVLDVARGGAVSTVFLRSFGNSVPLRDLESALQTNVDGMRVSVENYMSSLQETALSDATPRGPKQAKLAIVGMSCRLPGGATDTEKFWELLLDGRDVSGEIPADRFDIDTHYDADGKDMNKTMTRYGCFIDEPGLFDAAFFHMSPREAMAVDPQMRLALVTAYEALEKAGFVGNRSPSAKPERIGTFYGQAADDYREVNQGQEVGTYYIPGGCRAFGPGRINYFFKFAGPSYSVDTACSSGLAAIEIACQALWSGDIDMAVAGGVNILSNPDGFTGLGKGHFLSKGHNACKTWDAMADGYCRADGIGSLVIKRLEDAQVDNDNILGVILAAGTNHSAEAVSITHPHAGHQSFLSRQVLRQAAVNPLDVSYVELHGTGTQAGDYEEMQGILDVYAPNVSPCRRPNQALHIGSVKSNVGHGESVAGTTALIKVLLMLQHNAIPPHIGIKTKINPRLPEDLEKRNVHIPLSSSPWPQTSGRKRIAAVNNFGAAGGNTMLILEEAPSSTLARVEDPRSTQVVAVSAKTKRSLAGNIQRLIAALDRRSGPICLADLGYTTTARKYQHSYRVAVSASDVSQVKNRLASQLERVDSIRPVGKSDSLSVAFTFTGQGASHPSMSLELYHDVPSFREHVQQLDGIAQAQGFPSFIPAIDGSYANDHQHSAVVTQLALVCIEIALAQYWSSLGVKPNLVIGHSLGEYAALHVAGVISANDAIFMVGRRAEMLQTKCKVGSHCMMAVRASLADIDAVSEDKSYSVACINGPLDTVLSGTHAHMDDIAINLEAAGFRCIKLGVAFAFHSEQTDPILEDFELASKGSVTFHEPKLPVISPLLARVVFDGRTFNANYVRRATRETVDFKSALENAYIMSTISNDTIWIEIGPHSVCANFIKTTLSSTRVAVPSIRRGDNNWKTLSESMTALHLAGVDLNWQEFHRPFADSLSLVDLPTYAWDEKDYWLQYNGDWCLTKGNTYYHNNLDTTKPLVSTAETRESLSSSVQQIINVAVEGNMGTVVMQSDLMQEEFLAAAYGHKMNDCGVVTSSIHADIAYTLGDYLYRKFYPRNSAPNMDITNLVVTKGLIAKKVNMNTPQLIQVSASTEDIQSGVLNLKWHNVDADGTESEPFATAQIVFGKRDQWLSTWGSINHLVQSRIEMLQDLAAEGKACLLPCNMAYTLFAKNLVNYADEYRGMQSVVMYGLEGLAEVRLTTKAYTGKWTVPPYFIDSVAHLAGFIMNCSDAMDTQNNYCVTSGWNSMRFAEPLVAGARYRSYVKMIPTKEDSSVYLGDVYILRANDNEIIGMVGGIRFRSFPRILLSRFFSPPQAAYTAGAPTAVPYNGKNTSSARKQLASEKPARVSGRPTDSDSGYEEGRSSDLAPLADALQEPAAHATIAKTAKLQASSATSSAASTISGDEIATPPPHSDSVARKALELIARESALAVSNLTDDAEFSNLGIDSLMSLVLVEKFRVELDVKVNGSLFLDYPSIGDLRKWLEEYYG